ncbi:2-oxoglutaroyl-CoA hydrolase [Pseudonocardia sediminis]|uniref:2-oxoglutaroyl-CoA hydrolase n=1 Tax=Pseudonocardia sediminis TaxID=1397368 RepID=A0A4Q7V0J2_PSEST|nr:enoyl-CoA hydratase/isomerase family protein [Pseudonocardia sediminis]RZT86944.1 2-oxoglutaroyl-CoA hydrolase [Pseudonocardia sediminis]
MALTGGDVLLDRSEDGRIAYLTLSHGKYTVVTWEMRQLVADRFAEIDADPEVRVVVVRSDGEHFTSGGDIAGFMEVDPIDFTDLGHNVTAPARSAKPVIAAIDGYCFGVGCEMVLSCDIRLGTPRTQLALPEMNLGMIPGSGGTQRLSRLIGLSRAKYHIMTATRIDAEQAHDWGVLAEIHPDRDALYAAVEKLAVKMAGFSPAAQRTAKEVLDKGIDGPLHTGIDLERKAYAMLRSTNDFAEGVKAFGDKRKAEFTGR